MGRAPYCDKANVKKGPWSPQEDAKLKSYIEQHGTGGNWIALPQKIGLKRCGKSCRLRWLNYLRPNLKHGGFSEEEDNIICSLYVSIGSRWSVIAAQLPGRTDNDIKNYWNTRLKKKLLGNKNNKHSIINKEQQEACININNNGGTNNNNNNSVVIVKQESNNIINQGISINTHTFPHTTINQQLFGNYCFNNNNNNDQQDSIKKLLIKLGGRFSSNDENENGNYHPTLDNGFNKPQQFQEQVHHVESSVHCINDGNNNNNGVQFAQGDDFDLVNHFHGHGSFNATIEEIVSTNFSPQRLKGLEFLYGDHEEMASFTPKENDLQEFYSYPREVQ